MSVCTSFVAIAGLREANSHDAGSVEIWIKHATLVLDNTYFVPGPATLARAYIADSIANAERCQHRGPVPDAR
jgi:hypothetical protein